MRGPQLDRGALRLDLATHRPQEPFRVVAGMRWFDNRRRPACSKAGEQNRALDLGAGDTKGMMAALQPRPSDRNRRMAIVGLDSSPHQT